MRFRQALICAAVLMFVGSVQNEASAGRVRSNQLATPTTILPSRAEVFAVPAPERGRRLAYPVDVVRYGLTVHPGARFVRSRFAR